MTTIPTDHGADQPAVAQDQPKSGLRHDVAAALTRLRTADPGLAALRTAVRPAIVMPGTFALASHVIQNTQTSLFAAFGSFALLVLTDFSGPPRGRLAAYLCLAATGAAFITVGTLCSGNSWLAAGAMALVGFAVLLSAEISGYFAAATTGAILLFVLPVAIPAPAAAIPSRLAGWGLAAGACITAAMLLWPQRRVAGLRQSAARACDALADLADSARHDQGNATAQAAEAARRAIGEVRDRLRAAPSRPVGPARRTSGLMALAEELSWDFETLLAVATPSEPDPCRAENDQALAAAGAALRASAQRLAGHGGQPDLDSLDRAAQGTVQALIRRIPQLSAPQDEQSLAALVARTFQVRVLCYATLLVAGYALVATGGSAPEELTSTAAALADGGQAAAAGQDTSPAEPLLPLAPVPPVEPSVRQFAAEHASSRSVGLRNAVRGAAGLAIAVFVAQRSGVQHSFWVVLGTLSVLRSTALGTGRSVLNALAGTAAGIAVGSAILFAIGHNDEVLWAVLPVAVLIAAYAPRVISFAAGQAAFTVVLIVLYNLIQPVGWRVGLIRIEDVAIGFGVSLLVGLLFWPRGAGAVLRANLAVAYAHCGDYVEAAARWLTGRADRADPRAVGQAAAVSVHQLSESFRQHLAERAAGQADLAEQTRLVAGAGRVLRVGRSLESLGVLAGRIGSASRCGGTLDQQAAAVRSWFEALSRAIADGAAFPLAQPSDQQARSAMLSRVGESAKAGDSAALRDALLTLWASQHLDILTRQEERLSAQAAAASAMLPGR
ncbi:MAG TPA: FUSC family protein [Streptosporangiaceae bacterium]